MLILSEHICFSKVGAHFRVFHKLNEARFCVHVQVIKWCYFIAAVRYSYLVRVGMIIAVSGPYIRHVGMFPYFIKGSQKRNANLIIKQVIACLEGDFFYLWEDKASVSV